MFEPNTFSAKKAVEDIERRIEIKKETELLIKRIECLILVHQTTQSEEILQRIDQLAMEL